MVLSASLQVVLVEVFQPASDVNGFLVVGNAVAEFMFRFWMS